MKVTTSHPAGLPVPLTITLETSREAADVIAALLAYSRKNIHGTNVLATTSLAGQGTGYARQTVRELVGLLDAKLNFLDGESASSEPSDEEIE